MQFSATNAEKSISFSIEHLCPQCGAPIFLDEADRFFICPYCRVKSCIHQRGFARYYLPPGADIPMETDLIYLPYWRFKGICYACSPGGVDHWFTDISCLAMEKNRYDLHFSLGFRTQTLTLKRVSPYTCGKFIRPSAFKRILEASESRAKKKDILPPAFREDIGETFSLIYAPFYLKKNQLYDAVLNTPVHKSPKNFNIQAFKTCRPEKETLFIPGICPDCGWDLEGQSQSLVLVCKNCQTLWQPRQNRLDRIRFKSARVSGQSDVLIPFWKISARIQGFPMASYADLVQRANLPRAVQAHWKNQTLYFWMPAFKIRPKIFLRTARQLLIEQPSWDLDKTIQKNCHLPITLGAGEAIQSIKVILASLVRPLKEALPGIGSSKIHPKSVCLVFLPFETRHHDFINEKLNLSINRKIMALSENL